MKLLDKKLDFQLIISSAKHAFQIWSLLQWTIDDTIDKVKHFLIKENPQEVPARNVVKTWQWLTVQY